MATAHFEAARRRPVLQDTIADKAGRNEIIKGAFNNKALAGFDVQLRHLG